MEKTLVSLCVGGGGVRVGMSFWRASIALSLRVEQLVRTADERV